MPLLRRLYLSCRDPLQYTSLSLMCRHSLILVLLEASCLCLLVAVPLVRMPLTSLGNVVKENCQPVQAQSSQWRTCRQVNREGGPLCLAASQPLTPHVLLLRPCHCVRRRRWQLSPGLFSTQHLICAMLAPVSPSLVHAQFAHFNALQMRISMPSASGGVYSALITFAIKLLLLAMSCLSALRLRGCLVDVPVRLKLVIELHCVRWSASEAKRQAGLWLG